MLNTQQYKVLSRVKWSNPGKGIALSLHLGVVAIEKGAFWSPSTMAALDYGRQLYFYVEREREKERVWDRSKGIQVCIVLNTKY